MSTRDGVLVTGASGLVGAEVVARLLAAGRPVVTVVHSNPTIVGNDGSVIDGATFVSGNVREPALGIDGATLDELSGLVGTIVHCAATTAFDARPEDYEQLNVAGTDHAIALAQRWDVPLVHVSTAYVCGMRTGTVRENELNAGQEFGNGYEDSKCRAEQRVHDAGADGLRWSIVRPGIVCGTAGTGAIREFKNFYTVVKLMTEGKLRTLPGRYDATIALAPVDYVADVITTAVTDFEAAAGRTMHAVGNDVLSMREVSDIFAEYPSFQVATFVPETGFSAADLPGVEREYYLRIGSLYDSYFSRKLAFDTSNSTALLGTPPPASGQDYLRSLLDYCLETGFLGTVLPSIDDILAAETEAAR